MNQWSPMTNDGLFLQCQNQSKSKSSEAKVMMLTTLEYQEWQSQWIGKIEL